jgi:hypothetical protein
MTLTHRHVKLWVAVATVAAGLITVAMVGSPAQAGRDSSGLPPAKAALQQKQLNALRAAPAKPKPATTAGLAPQAKAAVQRPAYDDGLTPGIVDRRQGPFPAIQFATSNMYRAKGNGRWLFVFAGATRTPEGALGTTAVRVYQLTPDGSYTAVGEITAPVQDGQLTVTGANGTAVTLRTAHGTALTLDLLTLTFTR